MHTFPTFYWNVVPPPCSVDLHDGRFVWPDFRCYIITSSVWRQVGAVRRSDVFKRDFLPALDSLCPVLSFSHRQCQHIVPSLKTNKQTKGNQTTWLQKLFRLDPQPDRPPTTMKTIFLTPRGNVCVSSPTPAKGYFRAVVPPLPSRRLHCTPLTASSPKVLWIKQPRRLQFYLKHHQIVFFCLLFLKRSRRAFQAALPPPLGTSR